MGPQTGLRLNQIDGALCSHVVLASVWLDSQGHLALIHPDDGSYLNEVAEFKRKNPHTKVMISVLNDPEQNGFPKAAIIADIRQRFARSTINFLQHYQLDGIDLDWQFPNYPTTIMTREYERVGLTKILMELRSAIVENFYDRQVSEQHHQAKSHPNSYSSDPSSTDLVQPYLLTVAIAGQEAVLKASYELKQVANLCDWLNVRSYDYFLFKAYAPFTGPNSPLHAIVDPYVPILSKLSLAWTITRLIEEDVPRDKIVMGIPTFGRAYKLVFRKTQPTAFTLALGSKGGRFENYLAYKEVCDILKRDDTVVDFDERARVPYLLTDEGSTWISYENERSVREKVRYMIENNLAGYMTWNLNSDYFGPASNVDVASKQANGCGTTETDTTNFPLHRAMLSEIKAMNEGAPIK